MTASTSRVPQFRPVSKPGMKLLIHVSGGGRVHLQTDARDLGDIAECLRRERALVGQMTFSDEHGERVCDVLIPSNRIDFVVDADD